MNRVRQCLHAAVMALVMVVLCWHQAPAATWDIFSYNDGVSIDDSAISPATNYPYGITDWFIRYGSKPTNTYNPMFKEWFWYRIGNSGKQSSFGKLPVTGSYNADSSAVTLTYTDPQSRFRANVELQVIGKPTYSYNSTFSKTITIHNTSPADLDFHLYSYSDLDISEIGTDNVAVIKGTRVMQTGLNGRTLLQTSTLKPSHYDIDTLGTAPGSILDSLENGLVPLVLNDFAGPFPENGDMQFVFQYDLKIPVNGSLSFSVTNRMVETNPMAIGAPQAGGSCAGYAANTSYTICFGNTTNAAAANNVVLAATFKTDDLNDPSGTISLIGASDNGTQDPISGEITWTFPTLAAGAQQCVQATVAVNTTKAFTAEAVVYSDEAFPARAAAATPLCNYPPSVTSAAPGKAYTGIQYAYQVTALDAEHDTLTFTLVQGPSGMTITAAGLITWTPSSQQGNQSYPVRVEISDGHSTIQYSFSLFVQWQNQAPTAPPQQTATIPVSQPNSYQIVALDPDGQALTFTAAGPLPSGLNLSSSGLLSGTPTSIGTSTVSILVADPQQATVTTTLVINVTAAAPKAPTMAAIPAASVTAGAPFSYQVVASDPQGQTLTYSLTGAPSGLTISNSGLISWAKAVAGSYAITVSATNTSSLSTSQPLTLTVSNQAPTMAAIPAATITAPAGFSFQMSASDPNGDSLSYSLSGQPAGLTISSSGLISWDASVAGTYSVTVSASDPAGLVASQKLSLTVNPAPPKAPTMAAIPVASVTAGSPFSYQVSASDPQGQPLTYSLTGAPSGLTISNSGLIAWAKAVAGSYAVTVTATNTSNLSTNQSFLLTVTPPSPPPTDHSITITSTPVTTAYEGQQYLYPVKAVDSAGHPLTFSLTSAPSGMRISSSGIISWWPARYQDGTYPVSIRVSDGSISRSQSFLVTVREERDWGRWR